MIDFKLSDYIASAALAASVLSALYAKRQSESAKAANINSYRAQLSEQHAGYRLALSDIRRKHKADLSDLSNLAGSALTLIISRVDRYDDQTHKSYGYLRHVLHECSEMVFYAFKGQLSWQTGLNISMRFHHVTTIDDDLNPKASYFAEGDLRQAFERRYRNDPDALLEVDLRHDRHFCGLVTQLKSRIAPSWRRDFLVSIQDDLTSFRIAHEASRAKLHESVEELEKLLEEGQAQHFPLEESPQLYSAMRRQKAVLDTLSHLSIPLIDPAHAHHYDNYISIGVQTCAVLHAIQRVHSWGWDGG